MLGHLIRTFRGARVRNAPEECSGRCVLLPQRVLEETVDLERAFPVQEMADVVVSHGGQGTVQTALACGTPIVGVAIQLEQQINLDNVAARGAGIRIPAHGWKASTIQRTVRTVLEDGKYRENAQRLQQSVRGADGKKSSAEAIWQFVTRERE